MSRIRLTFHPEKEFIPASNALIVYHKDWEKRLPQVGGGEAVQYEKFRDEHQHRDFFAGKDAVVFVGTQKLLTPSTRLEPVWEVVNALPAGLNRYSVDQAPYISQLWRLWFHFWAAGVAYGDYSYSFLIESHYNAYLANLRHENPLSPEKIAEHAAGWTKIAYERYFETPAVRVVPMSPAVHEEYLRLKEELFGKHDRIQPIIRGLADFARKHCPERHIPQLHRIFDQPGNVRIVRTDLKVDGYLVNRLIETMNEANQAAEALRGGQVPRAECA